MYRKCQKCGKKLTDPRSMLRGYGPECWITIFGKQSFRTEGVEMNPEQDEVPVPGQMSFEDFPDIMP